MMSTPQAAPTGMAPLLSGSQWKRRAVLWGGAILVALVALVFAKAGDAAFALFRRALAFSPWVALVLTPAVFAALAWLTSGRLRATRGSGIPQVIAALDHPDPELRAQNLSLRVSAGKLALTVLARLGGASVGREGPTVHVGASLMYVIGRRFGFTDPREASRFFLLAGGAAGIAAAFNAPLAGVVFAIEELSDRYEHRFSGTLLTAVIVGGVVCGLLGGLFARMVLATMAGRPAWLGRLRLRHPVVLAAACGLVLAGLGLAFGPGAFGTGYEQARSLVQGHALVGQEFGAMKFVANLASYVAGIPGGLFSPALAVGAGVGHNLASLFPSMDSTSFVLLGMCAYLAGVTQAPRTSAVISMELTDNSEMMLPILATVLVARGVSSLVCHTPIYKALAQQLIAAMPKRDAAPETAKPPASTP